MSTNASISVNIADTILIGLTSIIYVAGVGVMSTSLAWSNLYMGILCIFIGIIMAIMSIYIVFEDSVPDSAKMTTYVATGTAIIAAVLMIIIGGYTLSRTYVDGQLLEPGPPFTMLAMFAFIIMAISTILINNMLVCYKANSKRNYWAASLLNYCAMISTLFFFYIAFINHYQLTSVTTSITNLNKPGSIVGPTNLATLKTPEQIAQQQMFTQ